MKKILHSYWPALLIAIVTIFIGCIVYQDYGLSWDELSQRMIGQTTYDYAVGNYPDFESFELKDHGPGFEWILMFIEKKMGLTELRDIFLMRHLVSFIFFVVCIISFYSFIFNLFKSKWIAALAMIAVLYHPRMFAHGFFNPKDIPALSMFILSIATAQWAFRKQKLLPFALLGIVCGYSACVRLMNIVIAAPLAVFFIADIIAAIRSKQKIQKPITQALVLLLFGCLSLYASWPTLWTNPIDSFIEVYNSYAKFNWPNDLKFMGEIINATNLPWYYIPVWFLITVPELWLILGFAGIMLFIAQFVKQPTPFFQDHNKRGLTISFVLLFLPLAAVIALNSVLYDGWRHLYFIYPCFITLAMFAINQIRKPLFKKIVFSLCTLQVMLIAVFMIKYHPYQQAYFNRFISHKENYLKKNYELDYWGASIKDALDWIAKNDNRQKIYINNDLSPILYNNQIITKHSKDRFLFTHEPHLYDYYIQLYRTHDQFKYPSKETPDAKIVYEEKVLNSTIFIVVKMH